MFGINVSRVWNVLEDGHDVCFYDGGIKNIKQSHSATRMGSACSCYYLGI